MCVCCAVLTEKQEEKKVHGSLVIRIKTHTQ